jgi:hypothetical protein
MGVFSAGRPVGRITLEIDIPEVVTTFDAYERALVNQRHRRGSITSFGRAHCHAPARNRGRRNRRRYGPVASPSPRCRPRGRSAYKRPTTFPGSVPRDARSGFRRGCHAARSLRHSLQSRRRTFEVSPPGPECNRRILLKMRVSPEPGSRLDLRDLDCRRSNE